MSIYLDNSSTTKPLNQVVEAMLSVLTEEYGNPSSGHTMGRRAKNALNSSRANVSDFLLTDPERIVFVSGATEANDAVLRSAFLESGRKLITTSAEHPSTRGVFKSEPERVIIVPTTENGTVNRPCLLKAMEDTPGSLLALGWVNSETGVIQPVQEICHRARDLGIVTLIDGAQAAGRIPRGDFDFPYDFLTISAHKMNGPKGVGCLVLGEKSDCPLLFTGGGQENGRRSGTENLPGIIGFGVACAERGKNLEIDLERLGSLRDKFELSIVDLVPDVNINGLGAPRVPSNTNITFRGIDGMALVARCDANEVFFSQLSACSTGKPEPSQTLMAMGMDEETAYSSVRFSVSVLNSENEIERAVEIIGQEVKNLRKLFGGL